MYTVGGYIHADRINKKSEMRLVYRYMVILCLFFIVPDTLRADGEDVLERMISLPKMNGLFTVRQYFSAVRLSVYL